MQMRLAKLWLHIIAKLVSRDDASFKWVDLKDKYVKINPQSFSRRWPTVTLKGSKKSIPVFVKIERYGVNRSGGKGAIFEIASFAFKYLHRLQFTTTWLIRTLNFGIYMHCRKSLTTASFLQWWYQRWAFHVLISDIRGCIYYSR